MSKNYTKTRVIDAESPQRTLYNDIDFVKFNEYQKGVVDEHSKKDKKVLEKYENEFHIII